jgi:hypothetical protein
VLYDIPTDGLDVARIYYTIAERTKRFVFRYKILTLALAFFNTTHLFNLGDRNNEGSDVVAGGLVVLHVRRIAKRPSARLPASAIDLLASLLIDHIHNLGRVRLAQFLCCETN